MDAAVMIQEKQIPEAFPQYEEIQWAGFIYSPVSPLYVSAAVALSMAGHDPNSPQPYTRYLKTILSKVGWYQENPSCEMTDAGIIASRLVPQYYHTAAYLKQFSQLPDLLRQNRIHSGYDTHLRRDIDIASSSHVFHSVCFGPMVKIIDEIFNRPLSRQPETIVDTGAERELFLRQFVGKLPGEQSGADP